MMKMDILVVKPRRSSFLSNSFNFSKSFRTLCSKKNSQQPQPNPDDDDAKDNKTEGKMKGPNRDLALHGLTQYSLYEPGDKFSTDWDKAWSNFKKQGKKSFSSQFSPNKYVTWNPRRSNYPLSEEVDPIKRTERSNLMLWTSPRFTLGLAIVIVSLLLIYTILAPMK